MHEDGSRKDLEALYMEVGPLLPRLVARNIAAPADVIEDGCQAAWSALLDKRDEVVPGQEFGWLLITASRYVLRQLREGRTELSIDDEESAAPTNVIRLTVPDPGHVVGFRERLAEVRRLPQRQQRMLWLQGFGYDYREISEQTGDSLRTVERQLLRARRRLAAGE